MMAWEWEWNRKKGKGGKLWVRGWYSDVYAVTLTKIGGETNSRISRKGMFVDCVNVHVGDVHHVKCGGDGMLDKKKEI